VTDADITRLEAMLRPILRENIDTLILGCTHFPALSGTIGKIAKEYGTILLVDSARVGADVLRKYRYGK
jgi:glutamate racemase